MWFPQLMPSYVVSPIVCSQQQRGTLHAHCLVWTHGLCAANFSKYVDNADAIRALCTRLDAAVQAYVPQEDREHAAAVTADDSSGSSLLAVADACFVALDRSLLPTPVAPAANSTAPPPLPPAGVPPPPVVVTGASNWCHGELHHTPSIGRMHH